MVENQGLGSAGPCPGALVTMQQGQRPHRDGLGLPRTLRAVLPPTYCAEDAGPIHGLKGSGDLTRICFEEITAL